MCKCTPGVKTPYCGKCGCEWPKPTLEPNSNYKATKDWPDPPANAVERPEFEAIWQAIKTWDINVPEVYEGYCGATGNHVWAILSALDKLKENN